MSIRWFKDNPPHPYLYKTCGRVLGAVIAAMLVCVPIVDASEPGDPTVTLVVISFMPLVLLGLLLTGRCLFAKYEEPDWAELHRATTPERTLIFSCAAFVALILFARIVPFDSTFWGLVVTVLIITPWLSYAQHVGELRLAVQNTGFVTRTHCTRCDELEARISSMNSAGLWRRILKTYQ